MAQSSHKLIGGFEIIHELPGSRGNQGRIFIARCVEERFPDIARDETVALKFMPVQDPDGELLVKLTKRTDLLTSMRHQNIVRYFGCFAEAEGISTYHVVVMEYLRGCTLQESIKKTADGLDVDVALRIIRAALSGLVYAAERGIIHRDIKPANIFVCDDGSTKLIDFEIARQEGGSLTVSSQGNLRGTFDYMAPDFIDPDFHGDECSDIFSLAVCLHETICGKTPYKPVPDDMRQAISTFFTRWNPETIASGSGVIKISSRVKRLVAHLERILSKGLSPTRTDRYPSFLSFREALQAAKPHEVWNGRAGYQILQFIGSGGFGEVFKARTIDNEGRFVAVKHLLKAAYADRFIREAKVLKRLTDTRFVQYVDFFTSEQTGGLEGFLIMDFLPGMPGSSLRDRLHKEKKGLPFEEVIYAFVRYAEGLAFMHKANLFHRDIKPSNLYLLDGHPETACIMDLGIARDARGSLTNGQVPGTLDYMPPEVAFGESRGDAGMDIYALGLCMYEALTCKMALPRLPKGDAAIPAFLERARGKQAPVLDHPDIRSNARLYGLLVRMTDPEASRREKDVERVAAALRDFLPANFDEKEKGAPPEPPSKKLRSIVDITVADPSPSPPSPVVPSPEPPPVVAPPKKPEVPIHQEEPPETRVTASVVPEKVPGPQEYPITVTKKTTFSGRIHPHHESAKPADMTRGTQIAPQDITKQLAADAAKQRAEKKAAPKVKKPLTLPPAFWGVLKKTAMGVLLFTVLAVAAFGVWHSRAAISASARSAWIAITDSVNGFRFNKRIEMYWGESERLASLRYEIVSPDKYLSVTNQLEGARLNMVRNLEASFGGFLNPPRKRNEKANARYADLKEGYHELLRVVKKDLETQADTAKKKVLDAYHADNLSEGDRKYTYDWIPWRPLLDEEKCKADEEEIAKARVGDPRVLMTQTKEAYQKDQLQEGDTCREQWVARVAKAGQKIDPKDEAEVNEARMACVTRLAKKEADQAVEAYGRDELAQGNAHREAWDSFASQLEPDVQRGEKKRLEDARDACDRRAQIKQLEILFEQTIAAYQKDGLDEGDKARDGWNQKAAVLEPAVKEQKATALDAARLACVTRLAQKALTQAVAAYQGNDPETGGRAGDLWRKQYAALLPADSKNAGEKELAVAKAECEKRRTDLQDNEKRQEVARKALKRETENAVKVMGSEEADTLRQAQMNLNEAMNGAKAAGLETVAALAVSEQVAQRIQMLTKEVPLTVVAKKVLDPAVTVRWSLDNAKWSVWAQGVTVPPGKVWIRFERDDYQSLGFKEPVEALPTLGCRVELPVESAWEPGEALKRLEKLRKQIQEGKGDQAEVLVKGDPPPFSYDGHATAWELLCAQVRDIKREQDFRTVQQRKVDQLVGQLKTCRSELGKGSTAGLAGLVWPHPEKDVAVSPAVVAAGKELAEALPNWVDTVACSEQPLATREDRLVQAREVLDLPSVVNLLGAAAVEKSKNQVATIERQRKVTDLVTHLQACRNELGKGSVTLLAELVWPYPEKGIMADPAVVAASNELAQALSNWAVAEAREERQMQAQKILDLPAVGRLLGHVAGGELNKHITELVRQRNVTGLVAHLQACRNEVGQGVVTGLADWVWPHPEKEIAASPAVVEAGRGLAAALAKWVAEVACADQPLETRAARLSDAGKALGYPAVAHLMGKPVTDDLKKQVADARAVFLFEVENGSGLAATLQIGGREETVAAGARREIRLTEKPARIAACVVGYREQPLPVNWAQGGGQRVSIERFAPLPITVEITGAEPGIDPPVQVTLADVDGKGFADAFGTQALPPGAYTLTFSRADYQQQVIEIPLKPGDPAQSFGPRPWVPSKGLKALGAAELACREKRFDEAAALLPAVILAAGGHQKKKQDLEGVVVSYFAQKARAHIRAMQSWLLDSEREGFQIADLQTGDVQKKPATRAKAPPAPDLPEWVLQAFDPLLREAWSGRANLPEKLKKSLEKVKDAHARFLQPSDFPSDILQCLSDAVGDGYAPNTYDLNLANYALEKCEGVLKKMIDRKISAATIENTRQLCDQARRQFEIIEKALRP